jgi:predicted nucleic acid-binding Zn ribbon protein
VFELFQKMSDPPPEVCIVCSEGPLQKVLYPVAAHFKGSGFYSTDYGRKGRKPSGDGDGPSKSDGDKPAKPDSGDKKNVKKVAES